MKSNNIDENLDELAAILRPIIDKTHSTVPTTMDNYGDYMTLIEIFARKAHEPDPVRLKKIKIGLGAAMVRAGAKKQGVISALQVMGVI